MCNSVSCFGRVCHLFTHTPYNCVCIREDKVEEMCLALEVQNGEVYDHPLLLEEFIPQPWTALKKLRRALAQTSFILIVEDFVVPEEHSCHPNILCPGTLDGLSGRGHEAL